MDGHEQDQNEGDQDLPVTSIPPDLCTPRNGKVHLLSYD